MPGALSLDAYNHISPAPLPGTQLTAATVGTTTPGTIAPVTAGAGVGSAIVVAASQNPTDQRGQFNVTGAGTPAAGIIAVVNFAQSFTAPPQGISVWITTQAGAAVAASATAITSAGFSVVAGAAISTAAGNVVGYSILP